MWIEKSYMHRWIASLRAKRPQPPYTHSAQTIPHSSIVYQAIDMHLLIHGVV
jgi:hypothetical protein